MKTIIIRVITLLCIFIWMLHMFFKLSMFKTDTILFIEVRNTPAPPLLISNWSATPTTVTSLFQFLLFHPS